MKRKHGLSYSYFYNFLPVGTFLCGLTVKNGEATPIVLAVAAGVCTGIGLFAMIADMVQMVKSSR